MSNKPRVFSGIKPTGNLHLGNYIGAVKQWIDLQADFDCIYCIVDLHAITAPQNPASLKQKTRELAGLYIACGVNPQKSIIFVQSQNPDHASLTWILDCNASMGQMERMTQYKTKSGELKGSASLGLFNYPVLMAADILLYNTDVVPVGEDQKQHVELTRDLAERFNSRFGNVFVIPKVKMMATGSRIMSLSDPEKKMSKSETDPSGTIDLLDNEKEIVKKIMGAVTDTGKEILYKKDKPGVSNLLSIYSSLSGKTIKELEEKYQGRGYGDFKKDLSKVVVDYLKPTQKRYQEIIEDQGYLDKILKDGLEKTRTLSQKTLKSVYEAVGLR